MDILSTLQNSNFLQCLNNTIFISITVSFLAIALGLIQAIALERLETPGKRYFKSVILAPFLIPPYIHTIAWKWLLTSETPLTKVLNPVLHSSCGAIFILTVYCTPLVTVILTAGLRLSSSSGEEVALMSRPPFTVLTHLILPSLYPHIAGSALITTVICMLNFSVPDILRVHVLPIEIFVQLSVFYDMKGAFIMSLPLVCITVLLILSFHLITRNRQFICIRQQNNYSNVILSTRGSVRITATVLLFLISIISVLPSLIYFIHSITAMEGIWQIIKDSYREVCYTFTLSGISSMLGVLVALPSAYIVCRRKTGADCVHLLFILPLAIPGALLALSLLTITNYLPFVHHLSTTSVLCVVGLSIHTLPFAIKLLEAELHKIDSKLEEAAIIHVQSPWQRFKTILLPLVFPGVLISFFFLFILSLGDLSISLLLVPPGRETVPVKIYNLMHYGADDIVAALSLFIAGIIAAMSLLTQIIYAKCRT